MQPDHQALAGETLHKFLTINRFLRQYARQMDKSGIHPRAFSVLRYLTERETATVGEVQEYLYCSASVASSVISKLEDGGYVTRTRSSEDNRVVLVEPTDTGRKLAAETPLAGIALLRRRLPTLEHERLARINVALADIMELMEVPETE
ncbi:MAG: MarR family winged helix-turn-helix transcriptional regulator [Caldilineaceae bacterium]